MHWNNTSFYQGLITQQDIRHMEKLCYQRSI